MRVPTSARLLSLVAPLIAGLSLGATAPTRAATIAEPQVFSSANGLLNLLMIAQPGPVTGFTIPGFAPTGWYYTVCQRPVSGTTCPQGPGTANTYGGFRLALQPGDELKIRLINNLPKMDPNSVERIHDDPLLALNPTDLHTHGLIVPAAANTTAPPAIPVYGDFVLTALFNASNGDPAVYNQSAYQALHAHFDVVFNSLSAADYDIHIPNNHPSGAYLIHPHIHGTSGVQMAAGMAGIISIGNVATYACYDEACNDPIPESSVRHLILKDMQVLGNKSPQFQEDPTFCANAPYGAPIGNGACPGDPGAYPGGYWFFSINGQQYPTIPVSSPNGEIWRFANTSGSATYDLQLVNNATQKPIALQVIAVDGVAVNFPVGSSSSQVQSALGNRFKLADCGGSISGYANQPICASEIVMMGATRVEVAVAYRDAEGNLSQAPKGAAATLRTQGIVTGPGGDPWPEVNLASVQFASGPTHARLEPVHVNAKIASALSAKGGLLSPDRIAARPRPTAQACQPLPLGHHRRIYFGNPNVAGATQGPGTDAYGNAIFGIGYEEIDQFGRPVPNSFIDVVQFDPSSVTCLPLGPGQTPVIENWELVNLTTELHNFHIHQTKFSHVTPQVAMSGPPSSATLATGVLEDSVPLPYANPGPGSQPVVSPGASSCLVSDFKAGNCQTTSVWVQIPFTQLGTFVFHCHILEHEDGGMMRAISVVPSPS